LPALHASVGVFHGVLSSMLLGYHGEAAMKEKLPFRFQAVALFAVCAVLLGIFLWVSEVNRWIAEGFRPGCSVVAFFVTFLGCRFVIEFRGKVRGTMGEVLWFSLGVMSTLLAFSVMIIGLGPPPARQWNRDAFVTSAQIGLPRGADCAGCGPTAACMTVPC
jgi:hypothetical protein